MISLLSICTYGLAQDKVQFYDQYGAPSGTAKVNDGRVQYYDSYGRPSGRAKYDSPSTRSSDSYQPGNSQVTTQNYQPNISLKSAMDKAITSSFETGKKTPIFRDSGELNGFIQKDGNAIKYFDKNGVIMSKEDGNTTYTYYKGKYTGFDIDKGNSVEMHGANGKLLGIRYGSKINHYDNNGKYLATKDWPPKK